MNAWTAGIAGSMVVALALGPEPQNRRVELDSADCSRHNMMFGQDQVAYAVQHAGAPMSAGVLDVQPDSNGGVRIEKGSGRDYSITACIGAGAESRDEAQRAADAVRLTVEGGRVRIKNPPSSRHWSVQLIIEAPDGAQINAETSNGPIGISGLSGTFTARASNGPIALDDVTGKVTARAANGPISVKGSRGEFDVQTDNGPITVILTGNSWDGSLEAQAKNGPLHVRIPADYRTGIEISSSRHSPWNCRVEACRGMSRDVNDGDRSVRIGVDPVTVRISTVNGPVTIEDAAPRR
ncbi:hypothetical protein BH18ACI5_BH18ACI5_06290 [soil metagenome]